MSEINELKNQIDQAKSILVMTKSNPNLDGVASALALYLVLKNAGKDVFIASQTEPIVRDSHLTGLNKIKTEIGNTNLVISFPYQEDSIEKVSYNVEGDSFNLVVQPKPNTPPIEKDSLKFKYTGASSDLVIIVGASSLKDVGPILTKEQELLDNTTICNISNLPSNFGKINLTDPNCSISEVTTAIIQEVGLELPQDAAQNLMLGIEGATNSLQSTNMTADTFEALAMLYRSGARRSRPSSITPEEKESLDQVTRSMKKPAPQPTSKSSDPDWLKPKIYKGSTKV